MLRFASFAFAALAVLAAVLAIVPGMPGLPSRAQGPETVTMEDRDEAMSAFARCLAERGLTATIIPGEGLRPARLAVAAPDADGLADDDTVRQANAAYVECRGTIEDVERRWAAQQGTPTSEQVLALVERLEACVRAGGVPEEGSVEGARFVRYENQPRPVQLEPADLPKYLQCARREEERTGLLPPFPFPGGAAENAAALVGR